jgi:hypothetical protein
MGFNEPDVKAQANLSVEEAVKLWKENIPSIKKRGKASTRIGSPAISNGPEGIPWLKQFIVELGGIAKSDIDYIGT